ncbi:MAG TPA: hypothetical protein VGM81_05620 [Burkholderiaceae bacterium]|jgi:hypothetical protein
MRSTLNPRIGPAAIALSSLLLLCMPPGALAVTAAPAAAATSSASAAPAAGADGWHDFDFEGGRWKTHLRRLLRPLTGSTTWVTYEGTSVVSEVWGGKANLLELKVDGPAGHLEGLSLRLYDETTRQWSLNFSRLGSGTMATPSVGGFKNGRGEFFNEETLEGRPILVRFVIHDIKPDSCKFEQAFSADGGKTWEVNWVAEDTRP